MQGALVRVPWMEPCPGHRTGCSRATASPPRLASRELTARVVEEDLVVEAQAQLGHARQEDAHLDGAHDLATKHVAIGADLGVEGT